MTPDQINQFFSFLYEGRIGEVTFWLRLIAGVLSAAFAAATVVILVKFRQLTGGGAPAEPTAELSRRDEAMVVRPWQEVLAKLASPNPSDWNLAVIRADAILDNVLKDMGLAGETMGERLKQLDRVKLASLDDVWEAHKLRNRIAHETDRALTHEETARAVRLFGNALRELGYLQT